MALRKAEKEEEKRAREKIRQKLEEDKVFGFKQSVLISFRTYYWKTGFLISLFGYAILFSSSGSFCIMYNSIQLLHLKSSPVSLIL